MIIKNELSLGEAFTAVKNTQVAKDIILQFCINKVAEEFLDKNCWYSFWDYKILGDILIIEYDYGPSGSYGSSIEFRDSIKVDMKQFLRDDKLNQLL